MYDMENSSMAVSWTSQHVPPGGVFSEPTQMTTWDYGKQQVVPAKPLLAAGNRFLTTGSVLTSLQKVCCPLLFSALWPSSYYYCSLKHRIRMEVDWDVPR